MPTYKFTTQSFEFHALLFGLLVETVNPLAGPCARFLITNTKRFGGSIVGLWAGTTGTELLVRFGQQGTRVFTPGNLIAVSQQGLIDTRNFHLWILSGETAKERICRFAAYVVMEHYGYLSYKLEYSKHMAVSIPARCGFAGIVKDQINHTAPIIIKIKSFEEKCAALFLLALQSPEYIFNKIKGGAMIGTDPHYKSTTYGIKIDFSSHIKKLKREKHRIIFNQKCDYIIQKMFDQQKIDRFHSSQYTCTEKFYLVTGNLNSIKIYKTAILISAELTLTIVLLLLIFEYSRKKKLQANTSTLIKNHQPR